MEADISKSKKAISIIESSLLLAWHEARDVQRPEGRTLADKALCLYLADLLSLTRELQSKLASL